MGEINLMPAHSTSTVEAKFGITLRDYQAKAINSLCNKKDVILHSPTGCHAKGQGILFYDGTIRSVESVTVGNRLMGPDSLPRTVLRLNRGTGRMYEIRPVKGKSFAVNEDHVLTLVRTNVSSKKVRDPSRGGPPNRGGEVIDVRLGDWLDWSSSQKHIHKLFRVGVEFPAGDKTLPVDPYMLGALLGDGSLGTTPCLTTADPELVCAAQNEASSRGLRIRRSGPLGYYITSGIRSGRPGGSNSLLTDIKRLGLYGKVCEDKFVPLLYRTACHEDRLAMLAGLLDTDGSLCHGFDFISKSATLADDVVFLARSVGLAAYVRSCQKSDQHGTTGIYHRVSISGELSVVPCRVARKRAAARRQVKNVLRTGFSVKPIGLGDYYGFTLDGDGRYLLDDFTVTHNSGKSVVFQGASHLLTGAGITVIVYPLRALIEDQQLAADKFGVNCVRYYGDVNQEDRADYLSRIKLDPTVSMVLTVPEMLVASKLLRDALKQRGVALMAIDEAHVYDEWALSFRSAYLKLSRIAEDLAVQRLLLCSATLTAQGAAQAARVFKRTEWDVISVPAIRPNLKFKTMERDPIQFLTEAVKTGQSPSPCPAIAFFTWKSTLEQISSEVRRASGAQVPTYHGDMGDADRKTAQTQWTRGREWMFATKAFGMGIDKADVRTIIHMQLPTSILDYAQEVGRAGRDGKDSFCYLPTFEYTTNGRRGDLGTAAEFLVGNNYPTVGEVETVWHCLYRSLGGKPGWHKVEPARLADACLSSDKEAPTVRKCISWLNTAEMLKKKQHSTDWILYPKAPKENLPSSKKELTSLEDVIEAVKIHGRYDGDTIVMSSGQMDDFVAPLLEVKDWKTKLKRWTTEGYVKFDGPGKAATHVQLISTSFADFAESAKLLTEARRTSFDNLSKVIALAMAPAHRRAEMIEQAIRLDVVIFERSMVELRKQLAVSR